jgi:hypothetical protein
LEGSPRRFRIDGLDDANEVLSTEWTTLAQVEEDAFPRLGCELARSRNRGARERRLTDRRKRRSRALADGGGMPPGTLVRGAQELEVGVHLRGRAVSVACPDRLDDNVMVLVDRAVEALPRVERARWVSRTVKTGCAAMRRRIFPQASTITVV